MMKNNFPALSQFLGGYFHQDFLHDYGDPNNAIATFVKEQPEELVRAACSELDQAIAIVENLQDPASFLWQELGCYYRPTSSGLPVVEWLRQVRAQLARK